MKRDEFDDLMERLRAGSDDAAWELMEHFGPKVLNVVRRKLYKQVRQKFDSADFVQAVWLSFFQNIDQLQDVESPEVLAARLSGMARNKVLTEVRRLLGTAKHDVRRESPVENHASELFGGSRPSEFAQVKERWKHLLEGEGDLVRKIVRLRVENFSFVEIGTTLGISERTARRHIRRLLAKTSGMDR